MNFFLKQMLQKQLAVLPAEQKEKIMKALDENPEFFTDLMKEVGERLKKGESQQAAIAGIMESHKEKLEKILKP